MTMKKIYLPAIIICSLLFGGCSSIPLANTTSYFRDLYKRIPYTVKGNYRVINLFYATSRQPVTSPDGSASFGNGIADNTSYQKLNVKIDPGLTIGKMLPERLKKGEIIGLQEAKQLDSDAFMKQLSGAVKSSPHNSLLVVVFGYQDGYEATAIKAAYFAYLLDVNTPVLLFDWPGDQATSIGGYKKAQTMARASGPQLGELLEKIARDVKPANLWVKASSLGCQVVCDAFDHMYKHGDMADADFEIAHVIFAAPDVDKEEFEAEFKNEISALAKKVTVYVSSNDTALLMSGFINSGQRLGRQDIQDHEHEQTEEAKDLLYLKSLDPDKITLIDVTPINKSSYSHGYYLEDAEFFDDVYTRFFDKEPNVSRRLYLMRYQDNTDYWVMRSEK